MSTLHTLACADFFLVAELLPSRDIPSCKVFRGCLLGSDVLNHRNIDFWSHQQPAYNLRGFISCAGTNFLIRASAFIEAGARLEHHTGL